MSEASQKQRMREALELTEANLTSFICTRSSLGAGEQTVITQALTGWRNEVRRALGSWHPGGRASLPKITFEQHGECICARCGIRHGLAPKTGDF
jgi:hypothetical protein